MNPYVRIYGVYLAVAACAVLVALPLDYLLFFTFDDHPFAFVLVLPAAAATATAPLAAGALILQLIDDIRDRSCRRLWRTVTVESEPNHHGAHVMTQTRTDLEAEILAETRTALTEHRAAVQAILSEGIRDAQRQAEDQMRAWAEASRRTFETEINRLHPRALWPIAFLAGAMGGGVAALVVDLILS